MTIYSPSDRISFRLDNETNFYLSELYVPLCDSIEGLSKTELMQRVIRCAYDYVFSGRSQADTLSAYRKYLDLLAGDQVS